MKKRMRFISMLLAVCIMLMNTTTVFAAKRPETGIDPQWTDVSMINSAMSVNSWGIAEVSVSGVAKATSSADSVELIVELQKYTDDWETIKTWTNKVDAQFAAADGKYAISKGYSYRLNITFKVYKGKKLLETATDIYSYGAYN